MIAPSESSTTRAASVAGVDGIVAAPATAGWGTLVAVFAFAAFAEGMFAAHLGAFLPLHLPRLGIAPTDVPGLVGLLTAASSIAGLPFVPLWGALADRYRRKPVIVRSFLVNLTAALVMLSADSVAMFMLGRALVGLSLANTGLMLATLSEQVPARRISLAFGLMNAAMPIGGLIGPPLGGMVFDRHAFAGVLAMDIVLLSAASLALVGGYRDTFAPTSARPLGAMARESIALLLGSPRLLRLFSGLAVLQAGWLAVYTYVPVVVADQVRSADAGHIVGLIMGAGGLGTILLAPTIGALGDRLGIARTFVWSAVIAALLFPLPFALHGIVPLGLCWALQSGVSTGLYSLSFVLIANETSPETRGRVMSFTFLPTIGGMILGPGVASLVAASHVSMVFPLASLLTLAGLAILARGLVGSR